MFIVVSCFWRITLAMLTHKAVAWTANTESYICVELSAHCYFLQLHINLSSETCLDAKLFAQSIEHMRTLFASRSFLHVNTTSAASDKPSAPALYAGVTSG